MNILSQQIDDGNLLKIRQKLDSFKNVMNLNIETLYQFTKTVSQKQSQFEILEKNIDEIFQNFLQQINQICKMPLSFNQYDQKILYDNLWEKVQKEALQIQNEEPLLQKLMVNAILQHHNFEDCMSHKLSQIMKSQEYELPWFEVIQDAFKQDKNLSFIMKTDLLAYQKDPAFSSFASIIIYSKGYNGLCLTRISHFLYKCKNQKQLAFLIQSKVAIQYNMDIHPNAKLGSGIQLDHVSGLVIGQFAEIGSGCIVFQNVTLGSNGKDTHEKRHPRVGPNTLIGANSCIIGNIDIGSNVKIGAGSVVLKSVPDNVSAVGIPAKIVNQK